LSDDGVRRLWCAVILNAINEIDSYRYATGAHDFIFSGERRTLGFIWLCDHLGLDAHALRQRCMTFEGRNRILRGRRNRRKKRDAHNGEY
jgi:hypothetical protein